ncbi:MAG: hypothetical protein V3T86_05005 [Planctomycetota bacterium]
MIPVTRTPRRRGERGTALIVAMLFSMIVAAYSASLLSSGMAVHNQSRTLRATLEAQQVAESGVHAAVALLNGPGATEFMAAGSAQGSLQGDGERAPRYRLEVTSGAADGIDNDSDLLVDEEDEVDLVEIVSTGSFDGVTKTVRCTLLARYRSPTVQSAAYISNAAAFMSFAGNSFHIDGNDVDLNGNTTGDQVPGIGVNGSPDQIIAALSGNQDDNVIGAGGDPSVMTVPELDMRDLIEEAARSNDIELAVDGNHQLSEPGAWGAISAPKILYAAGNIKVSGGAAGAGYLVVDGDCEISGGFEWRGVIIVRGKVSFKGGGGGKRLIGALIVEEDVEGDDSGLLVNGTIDVIYSAATITRISTAFASYTILNWREGEIS